MLRFLRYLRIAFSATCLIACVLLAVLWVRSYRSRDTVLANLWSRNFQANSMMGRLSFATLSQPMALGPKRWVFVSRPLTAAGSQQEVRRPRGSKTSSSKTPPFSVSASRTTTRDVYGVGMPHWAWLLLPATAAAVPWILWRKRFSLRSLLIAITLVAVGLGLIVWGTR
jgi:hypothetical protein